MALLFLDLDLYPQKNIYVMFMFSLETIRVQSERMMGALFEESLAPVSPLVPSIPMAAPDTGFVNMIQTGEE